MSKGSNKKTPQERRMEAIREHVSFASNSVNNKTRQNANTSASSLTEARLKKMLENPMTNGVQIANLSLVMKQVNGEYKRIIKYMSGLMTFDHTIYPVVQDMSKIDMKKMQEAYVNTAIFVDKLNPKFNLPRFTESLFTKGSSFQYKLEDSKGIVYQEFPTKACRLSFVEDGVYRFEFDVSSLSDDTVLYYPPEIQKAYNDQKNGNTDKFEDGRWYQVSDKGVAFTLDVDALMNGGIALPPLANSLIDAIKVENAKETMEDTAELDNTKIVHSQVATDDRGRPLMELEVVHQYHNALKRNLPDGAVAITNPFPTKALTLQGTGSDGKFSLLDKASDQLYKGAGVSPQLFADDNSSSQALERSIQVDCQWLYSSLLPMFANYYNYELRKASKKGAVWKLKFLNISHFDRSEAIKTAKDQLSFGGSRLEYLAYCGMTPVEVANMLTFEQRVLTIDDLMVAKQTSYTQSGKEDAGRPQTDDPTDGTVRIKDQQ